MRVNLRKTSFDDLVLVETPVHEDARGFFAETWNQRDFAAAGLDVNFLQDNHSRSSGNVLRGLHYQDLTAPIAKLVRCTRGSIFDVAVDLRTSSRTFGLWFGVELSERSMTQLYVPVGFAHGFVTLSEFAEVQYKQTGFYERAAERSIRWNDPELAIEWPVSNPILSDRDRDSAVSFDEYKRHPVFT